MTDTTHTHDDSAGRSDAGTSGGDGSDGADVDESTDTAATAATDGGVDDAPAEEPLLAVENLTTRFYTEEVVSAVDGVSYELEAGETLGIVGESGSGKSVSVRSVVGLVDEPGRIDAGEVRWKGTDLVGASNRELRSVRGAEIAMVFQNAEAAFDPTYTVGEQIIEAVTAHRELSKSAARAEAIDLLEEVGIGDPEGRIDDYPHEYSGGMAQRAMIAMALAGEPELLIADEPTTGLDVSIQAGIIDLFRELVAEREMALILISHDLGVVSQLCERMLVMYGGRVAERGTRRQLLTAPKHPYTKAFLDSIPDVDAKSTPEAIPGSPPNLSDPPSGCRFHPRCAVAEAGLCDGERPPTVVFPEGQEAECYAYTPEYAGDADYDREAVQALREPPDTRPEREREDQEEFYRSEVER